MKRIYFLFIFIFILSLLYFNLFLLSSQQPLLQKTFVINNKKNNLIKEKKPKFSLPKQRLEKKLEDSNLEKNQLTPTPFLTNIMLIPTNITKDNQEWGELKKISDHTYTIKVGLDERMATPKEIFNALNEYRYHHQQEKLVWNDRLAEFAQKRAEYFTSIGQTDEHQGFIEYVNNIENVKSLGFWSLGENSSYGYRLEAVHLIEWVFGASPEHNANQLSSEWSEVGIGVDGNQVDIIFGGNKIQ